MPTICAVWPNADATAATADSLSKQVQAVVCLSGHCRKPLIRKSRSAAAGLFAYIGLKAWNNIGGTGHD
jgi:hypothetical protein